HFEGILCHEIFSVQCWVNFYNFPATDPLILDQFGIKLYCFLYRQALWHRSACPFRNRTVHAVHIKGNVNLIARGKQSQCLSGDSGHALTPYFFNGEIFDPVLFYQVILRLLRVTDGYINNVLRPDLWLPSTDRFYLLPISYGLFMGFIELTFKIVGANAHGQRHTMHVAWGCGVRSVEVSMGIDPNDA